MSTQLNHPVRPDEIPSAPGKSSRWRWLPIALPWASYLQTPADIWLGHRAGTAILAGLAVQALWTVVLLGLCHVVFGAATRKVVVQGG